MPQLDLAISFSLYSSLFFGFFLSYFFFLKYVFFTLTQLIKLNRKYSLYQLSFLNFFKKKEDSIYKIFLHQLNLLLSFFDVLNMLVIFFEKKLIDNTVLIQFEKMLMFIVFFMKFNRKNNNNL